MTRPTQAIDRPGADEFELSIFGPGQGECVLVHLGRDEWICIDSFVDTQTRRPIALAYFDRIGVDPTAIKRVVATHWHSDHMRGLSEVLSAAPSARFVCPRAFAEAEFSTLIAAAEERRHKDQPLAEFARVLEILDERSPGGSWSTVSPDFAAEGSLVFERVPESSGDLGLSRPLLNFGR